MRHGEAGFVASSDTNRTLTPHGIQQAIAAGKFLREQQFHFDLALVSPYLRAQQTLTELSSQVSVDRIETNSDLVPGGDPAKIADLLSWQTDLDNMLIVSHLPLVGYLVNALCPQVSPPMFTTAAIACVHIPSENTLGSGTLEWIHQEA